jgi:hypothetical protein
MNSDKGYLKRMFISNRNKTINHINHNYDYTLIEEYLTKIVKKYDTQKNINLIISYYKSLNSDRNREIDLTIKINLQNKLFNKIIIIDETNEFVNESGNDNVIIVKNNNRLNFNDFFKYANEYSSDDTINVLCNSDIVIGEMFDKITLENNQILFLTRYEMKINSEDELNDDFGSFDTWVWKGKINHNIGNFNMGIGCCDVRLAREFYDKKFILKNPSLDLKTYHIHCTNIRYWYADGSTIVPCMKIKHSKLDDIYTNDDYVFLG